MGTNYQKLFYKDYEELFKQNSKLDSELRTVRYEYQLLLEINLQQQKEIERLKSILNRDGTNSGTPTSQTPINKQKIIPNSREKSGKKKGGQAGHKKTKLNRFADSEVNEKAMHTVSECPACKHTGLEKTGVNVGNVSMNKTRKIITGFTGNEINLSEGYLAKLQNHAASRRGGLLNPRRQKKPEEKMKTKKYTLIFAAVFFVFFIQFSFCQSYRDMENQYQADADIVRMKHFDYYAQLLTEYYEKNGKYPFQYEKEEPVYVFILTNFQEKDFNDTTPYKHFTVNDKYFFEELSDGLNRTIYEKYDPQKVGTDGRPNMYIYMVHGDYIYFAIHLYYSNPFTKNISKYYHKLELSNEDDPQYKLYTYQTLKKDQSYLELINRTANKQGFFDELDEQYKNDSQN